MKLIDKQQISSVKKGLGSELSVISLPKRIKTRGWSRDKYNSLMHLTSFRAISDRFYGMKLAPEYVIELESE